jgi:hypothetical protein
MKKLGLLSVAAAVALTSGSAFAMDLKVSADATVTGESLKAEALNTEANEYYTEEVNLGVEMKNDDGVTMKAGWTIYNGNMSGSIPTDGTSGVTPNLDYGYVIAPLGDITLKSGLVEAGPFGTDFSNSGNSAFKPFALDYKMGDMNIGFEEIMNTESGANNSGGGMIGSSGDGDTSSTRIYVKGKAGDLGWGARTTMKYVGKTATADGYTDTQTEVYAVGSAAGLAVAGHYVMQAYGQEGAEPSSGSGLYAHALKPMGQLTAGVAIAMLNDGFSSGAEFDPSTLTDKVLGNLTSAKDEATSLVVIPVIYKVDDKITVDGRFVTGKLNNEAVTTLAGYPGSGTSEAYTETDVNLNYALGKVTNVKLMYAAGSGEAVGDKAVNYMGWELSTSF